MIIIVIHLKPRRKHLIAAISCSLITVFNKVPILTQQPIFKNSFITLSNCSLNPNTVYLINKYLEFVLSFSSTTQVESCGIFTLSLFYICKVNFSKPSMTTMFQLTKILKLYSSLVHLHLYT